MKHVFKRAHKFPILYSVLIKYVSSTMDRSIQENIIIIHVKNIIFVVCVFLFSLVIFAWKNTRTHTHKGDRNIADYNNIMYYIGNNIKSLDKTDILYILEVLYKE